MIYSVMLQAAVCLVLSLLVTGCEKNVTAKQTSMAGTGPAPAPVQSDMDVGNFKVDHPEQFPLAAVEEYIAAPELNVTGVVQIDVSRQVPVPSLASGRVVEIDARLGDEVKQGQLLFKVRSTDIASAYADYRKAVKNEQLAKIQLDRAKVLLDVGAIPNSAYEVAQNAEDNAMIDLETATEHLRILGSDPEHPSGIVDVNAPVAGVITDQQITASSGVQALTPPNPFTISDLSHVWIVCDVYENNIAQVNLGEYADIHLAAYPGRVWKGRIGNILPVVDPNIRTAKVRLEVSNPGIMRIGMFVTATFHAGTMERHAQVPSLAVVHLHDREWVYAPVNGDHFQRLEVVVGDLLPGDMQEVKSGLKPGDRVVVNALGLETMVEQ
jgi:cobalt-zinc-cadmium efflux system membrane fusion protein